MLDFGGFLFPLFISVGWSDCWSNSHERRLTTSGLKDHSPTTQPSRQTPKSHHEVAPHGPRISSCKRSWELSRFQTATNADPARPRPRSLNAQGHARQPRRAAGAPTAAAPGPSRKTLLVASLLCSIEFRGVAAGYWGLRGAAPHVCVLALLFAVAAGQPQSRRVARSAQR